MTFILFIFVIPTANHFPNSELRSRSVSSGETPNSVRVASPLEKLQTPNSELRTPNSELRTPNSKLNPYPTISHEHVNLYPPCPGQN